MTSNTLCSACLDGYLCTETTRPTDCGDKGFCENNVKTTCQDGSFRDISLGISSSDCFSCPTGYFCQNGEVSTDNCDPGYFCTMNANKQLPDNIVFQNDAYVCPRGYYCEDGIEKTPCPVKTFNDLTGQSSLSGNITFFSK